MPGHKGNRPAPGQCPLQTMPWEGGWTHTHLLGRDLSPLEVSEDVLARCLHLPQEVSGDLARERRGFGWL